jgi:hypothetical protein
MASGCALTSVRGNRGENYGNEPLVRQKHIKKKKRISACTLYKYRMLQPENHQVDNSSLLSICQEIYLLLAYFPGKEKLTPYY